MWSISEFRICITNLESNIIVTNENYLNINSSIKRDIKLIKPLNN